MKFTNSIDRHSFLSVLMSEGYPMVLKETRIE
jgi:hypothetical protein